MEIENELISKSNNLTIYQNIGDYSNERQYQPFINVNNSEIKPQSQQFSNFESTFDNNSEMCVSPQEEEELYQPSIGSTETTCKDRFCWSCHKDRINIHCKQCPRSYHLKCIPSSSSVNNNNNSNNNNTNSNSSDNKSKNTTNNNNNKIVDSWLCIECKDILREEESEEFEEDEENSVHSQSSKSRLTQMSVEELSQLFKFALQTIRHSADPTFHKPVSPIVFPDYHQLVHYPMDLSTIDKNIRAKKYKSQLSFLADIKWIVHNCIIYNHSNHPLTTNAKYLSRVAKNEMAEMEICPDCFKNFYTVTDTSFAEPCRRPHQLVFARVKGYPLWPAKVVRLGKQNDVDCRFFGTHDRAWVAVDSCWLLSESHPGSKPSKAHKSKFEGAMRELAVHIDRLNAKFPGKFKYSPQKTSFSPNKIFICDEDNDEYNKNSEINIKSPKNENNINENSNNTNEETVGNASKIVTPGVFSLSSDNILDEFKSELNISNINETSNLLNKNIKSESQIKVELSAKTRTARVGKRNVAEALRASKILRTTNMSSSSSSSPSQRMQSNSSANNSHITTANSTTPKSKQQPMSSQNDLRNELESLKKQINFDNAMHKEEIREIKHNSDLVLMEMRQSWVSEKDKAIEDEKQKAELERKLMIAQFESEKKKFLATIEETKRKQWCAECLKEAQLFCCYDTWYCTYDCQKSHWKSHVNVCQQIHKKS